MGTDRPGRCPGMPVITKATSQRQEKLYHASSALVRSSRWELFEIGNKKVFIEPTKISLAIGKTIVFVPPEELPAILFRLGSANLPFLEYEGILDFYDGSVISSKLTMPSYLVESLCRSETVLQT